MKLALRAGALLLAGCGATHVPPTVAPMPAPEPALVAAPAPVLAEPPATAGAAPLEGALALGAERPTTQTIRFDVDALPVATWGEAWQGAGFTLRKVREGWSLWVRTTIFAEVIVTATAPSSEKGTTPVGFTAFTGGSFGEGSVPACGPGSVGQRLAVWDGFGPAGWTDDGMNVEMEEGDFDLATCAATPVRSLRGRASAVVRGYVYAVRARDTADDGNDRESLVVFLPRGSLVATASDPRTPFDASNSGPFTRLTFPLERGRGGSASLRLAPGALAMWARLRQMAGPVALTDASALGDNLLLGVDVAWQGDVRLGSVTFSVPNGKARKGYAGLLAAAKKQGM